MICILHANDNLYNWPSPVVHFVLVYVLSKMLKLCGAEGSSFRWLVGAVSCFVEVHWSLFGVDLVAEQRLVCVEVHQIGPCDAVSYFDWCSQLLRSIRLLFLRWTSCEVAYWILSTVCCWSSIGAAVRGAIFGCCRLFCWWISVLVFPQTHRLWISFNAECSEMRFVRWWACSGSNHLTRVSGWWCQIVVWLLSAFVEIN